MKAVAQRVQQRRSSIDRDLVALAVDLERDLEGVLGRGIGGPRPVLIDLKHRMLLDERQSPGQLAEAPEVRCRGGAFDRVRSAARRSYPLTGSSGPWWKAGHPAARHGPIL